MSNQFYVNKYTDTDLRNLLEAVLEEIEQRDYNDRTREFSPLVKAVDAIEIDTSFMNVDQVIAKVFSYIN